MPSGRRAWSGFFTLPHTVKHDSNRLQRAVESVLATGYSPVVVTFIQSNRRWPWLATIVAAAIATTVGAADRPLLTQPGAPPPPLDRGFLLLYDLDFDGAQKQFAAHQQGHPEDPMGHVGEAAGYLFAEFHRLGILDSQFIIHDGALIEGKRLKADPDARKRFDVALAKADTLAKACLRKDPRDRSALLASTLSNGLRCDYIVMIEKRNAAALRMVKLATQTSQKLITLHPDCYDAYVATGVSKYVIGSLILPLRWLLSIGGFIGDKTRGEADLELTARSGRYLAPYAQLMLAIIAVREKRTARAREWLIGLQQNFPRNPLYGRELERLNKPDPATTN